MPDASDEPLRILHVVQSLSVGGAEQHLVDLVRLSDPRRLQHAVCALLPLHALRPALEATGVPVVALGLPGKHPWVRGALGVRRLIRQFRPHVVQTWLFDADVSARLAVLSTRHVPLVSGLQAAIYDPEVVRMQNWSTSKVRAFRLLDRVTARLTGARFVSLSNYVVDSYREHFGLSPDEVLAVIPNAVELRRPEVGGPALRRSLGIAEEARVVINVGRLDEQKGQDTLIRAFAAAFAGDPGSWLVIFGEGSRRDGLTKLASELGVADRVLLPGVERDIGSAYAMADVFAFPSLHEGLGMAIIEAMAAGVACVGSDIPPVREVLDGGRYGRLVPARDAAALADVLKSLAADAGARAQLGQAARDRAEDYTYAATLPRWEQVYREIVGRG